MGPNFADDVEICDLGVLEDFVSVDEKASFKPMYVLDPLEN